MILSDTAIRRPVFTTMIIGAIIVFGAISFRRVGIDLFPRVEFPIVTIVSVLPGADPETVETTVTDPIEEAVATIGGIKHLRSTSSDSVSQVVIEFDLERNIDVAYQEVQAKLGTVRSELPKDLEDPVIEKMDLDAAPILAIVVSGNLSIRDLTQVADKVVKARLQRVRHVGQVKLVGGRDRTIWVWLDRERLAGYGLTVQDVEQALQREHVEIPGGRVETGAREWLVRTRAEFTSGPELENLVVSWRDGAAIRLRDLGRVEDGLEEERSLAVLDQTRAVSLLVRRQSGTNTVQVAEDVKREVERLRDELKSQGVRLEIAQDLSVFIEHSVHEVQFHLLFGGGLAVIIVFLFLRNFWSTVISAMVLPTSVIGTFLMLYALGFTQNMMTLLALSLAIGLLIDDAIVVQENTMRHVEEGMPPPQAAAFATSEIALAVFATTLSVVAVFVPVAFTPGLVGRFFYQFGLTVAFAVLISMFVSFTLDPMLSARLLRKPRPGMIFRASERFFLGLERGYEWILGFALRWRILVVLIALGSFAASLEVARALRSEFIPLEDQSEFNVKVKAPLGSSLQTTAEIFTRIRARIAQQPWLDYTFNTLGADELQRVNEGTMYVKMVPKDRRTIGQQEAMLWAREQLAGIRDAKVSVEVVPRVSGGGFKFADVQLEVRGTDLTKLREICGRITDRLRKGSGYLDVDTSFEAGKPELEVYVDRDRAADLGVSPLAVAGTVRTLIGGDVAGKFRSGGDRYDIRVRLAESFRRRVDDIDQLSVRGMSGDLVRMQSLVTVQTADGPVQINRYNRARQITIYANLDRGKKVLGEAVAELTQWLQEEKLPAGYSSGFAGNAEMMGESFANLLFALVLGIIVVYMVLASQFESFLHPLTIMLSLPLSVVGALGALVWTEMTLSIFTMIGLIMLMGLVTKNGILLVDFTNTLRSRDGLSCNAALRKAGPVRLRPILMTTLAMIAGMLPVALDRGAGSESRAPMAVAVIGGLTTSTLLTLLVVPVAYSLFDDLVHPRGWRVVEWILGPAQPAAGTEPATANEPTPAHEPRPE